MEQQQMEQQQMEQQQLEKRTQEYSIKYDIVFSYEEKSKYFINRIAKLVINGVCWGRFSICGYPFYCDYDELYNATPNLMSLEIEDPYKNMGFDKILIEEMVKKIKIMEPDIKDNQMFYVDVDISNGYWSYIGMHNLSFELPQFDQGYGCDKYITFRELKQYAQHIEVQETDDYSDYDN